jgi:hypothetical protein
MKRFLFIAALFFQSTAHAQYQVQKGHWFISHIVGGYGFTKVDWREEEEGRPEQRWTSKDNVFRLGFTGPDWGSVQLNSYKSTDESTGNKSKQSGMEIWLEPQAGFFIRDNFMIGASAVMGYGKSKNIGPGSSGKEKYWALGIGPAMRYYFGKNVKKKPFAGFESRFDIKREDDKEYYSDDFTGDRNEYHTKGSKVMVRPFAGYALFVDKRWTADVRVEYTYTKETSNRTRYYYEDETLDSNYPQSQKVVITNNVIAISFGISYTF